MYVIYQDGVLGPKEKRNAEFPGPKITLMPNPSTGR